MSASEADRIYHAAFDATFNAVENYEVPWFDDCHQAGMQAVVERAAQEADRGYLASENCDDIATRIRALTTQTTDPHVCENCPTCGMHDGRHDKCCGCYDGVCCQESTEPSGPESA